MADAVITDAMRWRYMVESQNNASGFIHLLKLLSMGKGDMSSFIAMTDRIIRSAQAAKHTEVSSDDLLEALKIAATVIQNASARLQNVHMLLARDLEAEAANARAVIAKAEAA